MENGFRFKNQKVVNGKIVSFAMTWPDGLESNVEQIWADDGSCVITYDGQPVVDFQYATGESSIYRHSMYEASNV